MKSCTWVEGTEATPNRYTERAPPSPEKNKHFYVDYHDVQGVPTAQSVKLGQTSKNIVEVAVKYLSALVIRWALGITPVIVIYIIL